MNIDIKSSIHNKFVIEVKNIATGEIEQRGYAENIVLNQAFTKEYYHIWGARFFSGISYGDGSGTLSTSRTDLFNRLGSKETELVSFECNEPPMASFCIKKIVILPAEAIGKSISEVGISAPYLDSILNIYTHALIKDSEGNLLTLEPKTSLQEITIYATVYYKLELPLGVKAQSYDGTLDNNSLLRSGIGYMIPSNPLPKSIHLNSLVYANRVDIGDYSLGKTLVFPKVVFNSVKGNGKIKKIYWADSWHSISYQIPGLEIDILEMAQNNSDIWGGYEFKNKLVGTGDGATKVFNLVWDEVVLAKTKKVYVDGVEKTNGVTWADDKITFDDAPIEDVLITLDYWVDYIPKDTGHELWIDISLVNGEGVPE